MFAGFGGLTCCFAEGFGERFFGGRLKRPEYGVFGVECWTDKTSGLGDDFLMETSPISTPRIIDSDRLDEGLLVFFSDGKSAFYSADLLYSMIELAEDFGEVEAGE
jgi:hypothetical protein